MWRYIDCASEHQRRRNGLSARSNSGRSSDGLCTVRTSGATQARVWRCHDGRTAYVRRGAPLAGGAESVKVLEVLSKPDGYRLIWLPVGAK